MEPLVALGISEPDQGGKKAAQEWNQLLLPHQISENGNKRLFPFNSSVKTLISEFGFGVGMYFTLIQLFGAVCLLLALLCIPLIILHWELGETYSEASLEKLSISNVLPEFHWQSQTIADFMFSIILFSVFFWRFRKAETQYRRDQRNIHSTGSYSVNILNPPSDLVEKDVYVDYFSNYGQVVSVCFGFNHGGLVELANQRKIIKLQLNKLTKSSYSIKNSNDNDDKVDNTIVEGITAASSPRKSIDPDSENTNSTLPTTPSTSTTLKNSYQSFLRYFHLLRDGQYFQTQLDSNTNKMDSLFQERYKVCQVFITFQHKYEAEGCLLAIQRTRFDWLSSLLGLFSVPPFQGKQLDVIAAPEPSDILWKNLHHSRRNKRLREALAFFVTLALLILSFVLLTVVSSTSDESVASRLSGALTVVAINITLFIASRILSKFEKPYSQSQWGHSIMQKLTVFQFINTAIVPYIVGNLRSQDKDFFSTSLPDLILPTEKWFETSLSPILAILLVDAMVGPLIRYFLPLGLKSIKSLFFAPFMDQQHDLNVLFRPPDFHAAEIYANAVKMLWVASFYSTALPLSYGIYLVGFALGYLSDKYLLLRSCYRPPRVDFSLPRQAFVLSCFAALVKIWSSFIFIFPYSSNTTLVFFLTIIINLLYLLPLSARLIISRLLRRSIISKVVVEDKPFNELSDSVSAYQAPEIPKSTISEFGDWKIAHDDEDPESVALFPIKHPLSHLISKASPQEDTIDIPDLLDVESRNVDSSLLLTGAISETEKQSLTDAQHGVYHQPPKPHVVDSSEAVDPLDPLDPIDSVDSVNPVNPVNPADDTLKSLDPGNHPSNTSNTQDSSDLEHNSFQKPLASGQVTFNIVPNIPQLQANSAETSSFASSASRPSLQGGQVHGSATFSDAAFEKAPTIEFSNLKRNLLTSKSSLSSGNQSKRSSALFSHGIEDSIDVSKDPGMKYLLKLQFPEQNIKKTVPVFAENTILDILQDAVKHISVSGANAHRYGLYKDIGGTSTGATKGNTKWLAPHLSVESLLLQKIIKSDENRLLSPTLLFINRLRVQIRVKYQRKVERILVDTGLPVANTIKTCCQQFSIPSSVGFFLITNDAELPLPLDTSLSQLEAVSAERIFELIDQRLFPVPKKSLSSSSSNILSGKSIIKSSSTSFETLNSEMNQSPDKMIVKVKFPHFHLEKTFPLDRQTTFLSLVNTCISLLQARGFFVHTDHNDRYLLYFTPSVQPSHHNPIARFIPGSNTKKKSSLIAVNKQQHLYSSASSSKIWLFPEYSLTNLEDAFPSFIVDDRLKIPLNFVNIYILPLSITFRKKTIVLYVDYGLAVKELLPTLCRAFSLTSSAKFNLGVINASQKTTLFQSKSLHSSTRIDPNDSLFEYTSQSSEDDRFFEKHAKKSQVKTLSVVLIEPTLDEIVAEFFINVVFPEIRGKKTWKFKPRTPVSEIVDKCLKVLMLDCPDIANFINENQDKHHTSESSMNSPKKRFRLFIDKMPLVSSWNLLQLFENQKITLSENKTQVLTQFSFHSTYKENFYFVYKTTNKIVPLDPLVPLSFSIHTVAHAFNIGSFTNKTLSCQGHTLDPNESLIRQKAKNIIRILDPLSEMPEKYLVQVFFPEFQSKKVFVVKPLSTIFELLEMCQKHLAAQNIIVGLDNQALYSKISPLSSTSSSGIGIGKSSSLTLNVSSRNKFGSVRSKISAQRQPATISRNKIHFHNHWFVQDAVEAQMLTAGEDGKLDPSLEMQTIAPRICKVSFQKTKYSIPISPAANIADSIKAIRSFLMLEPADYSLLLDGIKLENHELLEKYPPLSTFVLEREYIIKDVLVKVTIPKFKVNKTFLKSEMVTIMDLLYACLQFLSIRQIEHNEDPSQYRFSLTENKSTSTSTTGHSGKRKSAIQKKNQQPLDDYFENSSTIHELLNSKKISLTPDGHFIQQEFCLIFLEHESGVSFKDIISGPSSSSNQQLTAATLNQKNTKKKKSSIIIDSSLAIPGFVGSVQSPVIIDTSQIIGDEIDETELLEQHLSAQYPDNDDSSSDEDSTPVVRSGPPAIVVEDASEEAFQSELESILDSGLSDVVSRGDVDTTIDTVDTVDTVDTPDTTVDTVDSVDTPDTTADSVDTVDTPDTTVDTVDSVDTPDTTADSVDTVDTPDTTVDTVDPVDTQVTQVTPESSELINSKLVNLDDLHFDDDSHSSTDSDDTPPMSSTDSDDTPPMSSTDDDNDH